ncbi:glycosyltransferase [Bacillus sp. FJAT-49732]|uniref:Glycosyltransferase n=1 Tax=Lederbergia citrisecunda TaxID=2833583 RepID=A0A942TPP0_9BACI|nr:glycosyltransferase [Lederbergia citrisecunda]MBS4200592.1 glycosyltransferase [Lederbergia citrisecunda]
MVTIGSLRFSGAERVLLALANALQKKGNEVILLAMQGDESSPYKDPIDRNVEIQIINYQGGFFVKNLKRIFAIRNLILRDKPDVIISFGYILNPIIILASMFTKVPIIISERNDPKIEPKQKKYRILRKILYPFSNNLVVQTEEIADFFKPFMKGKISIIPNPITNLNIPQRYIGDRKNTIVSVGRLDQKQKNQILLIRAFSKITNDYPDYKLMIYGEGDDRRLLEDEIYKLGLEGKIELPGQKDNIMELIRDARMFVLSSDFEGMPNALIEAMAMGIPSISTDCGGGGARALILTHKNGILVRKNDNLQLAEAMRYIIENPEKALKISDEALLIREKLSINKIVKSWEDLLISQIK